MEVQRSKNDFATVQLEFLETITTKHKKNKQSPKAQGTWSTGVRLVYIEVK